MTFDFAFDARRLRAGLSPGWARKAYCLVRGRRSCGRAVCLACAMFPSFWALLDLQAQSPPQPSEEKSSVSQVAGAPKPLASAESTTDSGKHKKKAHRGALVPAPIPISSPAVGVGIVPGLGYIFPFSTNDKISPPSTIGAAGLITNNGSRGFGLGADLYMKENTYEITSIYAHGNVNYDLYGSDVAEGLRLPLTQSGHIFRAEVLRRLWWKVFVGPRFWTGQSFVTVAPNNGDIPPPPS